MTATATTAKRARPRRTPAILPPHACVVLAIDTAHNSGWAIRESPGRGAPDRLIAYGELDVTSVRDMYQVCAAAARGAIAANLPAILVLESPWGGTRRTVESLSRSAGRWLACWGLTGQSAYMDVQPSAWRTAVLGAQWAHAKRDIVRAYEQRVAAAEVGTVTRPDESAAILISSFAVRSPKVAAILKRSASA
jgi:hypothetical protein